MPNLATPPTWPNPAPLVKREINKMLAHVNTLSPVQFAFNTLARVTPVSHGVCNVVKRIVIIATSGEYWVP